MPKLFAWAPQLHLQHDFHVHWATGTPYWPILPFDILKIQNKHFYSPYSNETFYIKALEYKEYFTHINPPMKRLFC
jgi:hypothetical protein